MWFSTLLACQCYSSWKLFCRKLSFRILFIFLKLILPISYVGNPSVLSAKRSQYTKVKVNPIALYTYVKSACKPTFVSLSKKQKIVSFLCQNRKLSFNSHWVLAISRKCNMPAAKALFTVQLTRILVKNMPSHFAKVGHHIFARHLQYLIIFIAKQNVWLTQTLKI